MNKTIKSVMELKAALKEEWFAEDPDIEIVLSEKIFNRIISKAQLFMQVPAEPRTMKIGGVRIKIKGGDNE